MLTHARRRYNEICRLREAIGSGSDEFVEDGSSECASVRGSMWQLVPLEMNVWRSVRRSERAPMLTEDSDEIVPIK